MDWSQESFWAKTKEYMLKAIDAYEQSELSMFAFWSHLSLEPLAKGTLAYIHPILVAEENEVSRLASCGIADRLELLGFRGGLHRLNLEGEAKTKKISAVFKMIADIKIVEGFGQSEEVKCNKLMSRRNSEFHSGTFAFDKDKLKIKDWLPDFFRISKMLLVFQGKSLEDFWGPEFAPIFAQQVEGIEKEIEKEVEDRIKDRKNWFFNLSELEQRARKTFSVSLDNPFLLDKANYIKVPNTKQCPACGSFQTEIYGTKLRSSKRPIYNNIFQLIEFIVVLPSFFYCASCELKLNTTDELLAANIGQPFTVESVEDDEDTINFYGEWAAERYAEEMRDQKYDDE